MLELMAMSYVVSVCLYLARRYPNFPKLPNKQSGELLDDFINELPSVTYQALTDEELLILSEAYIRASHAND